MPEGFGYLIGWHVAVELFCGDPSAAWSIVSVVTGEGLDLCSWEVFD